MKSEAYVRGTSLPSLGIAILAVGAVACGTNTYFTATNTPPRPLRPRPIESVEVFTEGPPQRPFVEVGRIDAQQRSGYSMADRQEVLGAVQLRASEVGCDAVVITGVNNDVVDTTFTPGQPNIEVLEGVHAACLMYKNGPPAPRFPLR